MLRAPGVDRIHLIAPESSILVEHKQCTTKKTKLKQNDKSRAWLADCARAQTRQIADKFAIYKRRLHLNGTRILSSRIVEIRQRKKIKTATRIVSTSRSDASFICQKDATLRSTCLIPFSLSLTISFFLPSASLILPMSFCLPFYVCCKIENHHSPLSARNIFCALSCNRLFAALVTFFSSTIRIFIVSVCFPMNIETQNRKGASKQFSANQAISLNMQWDNKTNLA